MALIFVLLCKTSLDKRGTTSSQFCSSKGTNVSAFTYHRSGVLHAYQYHIEGDDNGRDAGIFTPVHWGKNMDRQRVDDDRSRRVKIMDRRVSLADNEGLLSGNILQRDQPIPNLSGMG